ncbi:MAG TPA: glycosyltransferase, partial [Candidatus Gracilibacteria bacterium]|nr:glycosyltransferase [Candidatus Gracilibacteria bacterium]
KKVKKLNLEEKVIMPGYIEEIEKTYLYENCSLFAFPSLYEGFGFPILEAFSFNKPVLTSHVSCLPEVAGEAACYVDPFDPEDIARGLEKIISDKDYSKKLIDGGKERLNHFSWEKSVKQTFDVLTKGR